MASEDSDELVPGFSSIHRLHDLDDVGQTVACEVMAAGHHLDTRRELLEIEALRGPERILPEERDDPPK